MTDAADDHFQLWYHRHNNECNDHIMYYNALKTLTPSDWDSYNYVQVIRNAPQPNTLRAELALSRIPAVVCIPSGMKYYENDARIFLHEKYIEATNKSNRPTGFGSKFKALTDEERIKMGIHSSSTAGAKGTVPPVPRFNATQAGAQSSGVSRKRQLEMMAAEPRSRKLGPDHFKEKQRMLTKRLGGDDEYADHTDTQARLPPPMDPDAEDESLISTLSTDQQQQQQQQQRHQFEMYSPGARDMIGRTSVTEADGARTTSSEMISSKSGALKGKKKLGAKFTKGGQPGATLSAAERVFSPDRG